MSINNEKDLEKNIMGSYKCMGAVQTKVDWPPFMQPSCTDQSYHLAQSHSLLCLVPEGGKRGSGGLRMRQRVVFPHRQ